MGLSHLQNSHYRERGNREYFNYYQCSHYIPFPICCYTLKREKFHPGCAFFIEIALFLRIAHKTEHRPNCSKSIHVKLPIIAAALLCASPLLCEGAPLDRIQESQFGTLDDGDPVTQFTLRNANGMQVRLISYGAIITEILVPDREGVTRNVVVGSDSLEDYLGRFPAAAVIGRYANRIAHGAFEIDGVSYQLSKNARGHHIHGGTANFAKQNWRAEALPPGPDRSAVRFTHVSPDGEAGYPGRLTTTVVYTLTDRNALEIQYNASTDRPTIVNLTNHAYFNLANEGDYQNHILWLNADSYTLTDSDLIPTGAVATVANTPMDFTQPTAIGSRRHLIGPPRPNNYDNNYILNRSDDSIVVAARVHDPISGRSLEVRTDQPGVQLYTGNSRGFCLETQHYPDAINHSHFPSPIVRPGSPFKSETHFVFSTR